jgi:hypothetical protein
MFMKKLYFFVLFVCFGILTYSQTTVDFETVDNWIKDPNVSSLGSYGNHFYQGPGITFQGTNVSRETSGDQDGYPKTFGEYAFRIRNVANSGITIQIAAGGVSNFEFKVRRWDGDPIPVYTVEYSENGTDWTSLPSIDGTLLQTSDWYTYASSINSSAEDLLIRISNTGTTERIMIDNFTWYPFSGGTPALNVSAPVNNLEVNEDNVDIIFTTSNFVLGTDGKLEIILNGGAPLYTTTSPYNLTGLVEGSNTINMQLVDMSNQALNPAVVVTRTVNYVILSTDPELTINSPANGTNIYSQDVTINFTVTNFILGTDGKIKYSVDGGADMYHLTNDPISLTGLSYASHIVVLQLVDMANNPLTPDVSASVTFTCVEPAPGGMETFDNCNATASYTDGSFVGNYGIVWNYFHSRDTGAYPINGKGLMLRRGSDSKLESAPISGGIGSFELKMRKAFTGATPRQLELYINGNLIATSQEFGAFTGADETIYTFSVPDINIPGDFVMMIKPVSTTETNRQITIDDISWTGYLGTDPFLSITSPVNGSTLSSQDVNIVFNVVNFNLGTDGKVKYQVNGGAAQFTTSSPISLTGLAESNYTVTLQLVDMSDQPLVPDVTASVSFTIELPTLTTIYEIQYTDDPNGNSPLADQTVTTRGVVSAVYGDKFWLQDGYGPWNGIYVYYTVTPGPQIGDSVIVNGKVVEYLNLTEISPVYSLEVLSTGNPVANPTVLQTGSVGQEQHESTLVRVTGVCTNPNAGYGMFILNDGSGEILVDDVLYSYPTPTANNSYTVTGVLYYSYSEWKILPRSADDIIDNGVSTSPMLTVTSPANNSTIYNDNLSVEFTVTNFNLGTDGKVSWSLDGGATSYVTASPILLTGLTAGEHSLRLELVDMSNNPLTNPVIVIINFTVDLSGPAFTDIYDIQYTTNTNGNSPLNGENVWIRGVVSANFNGTPYHNGYYVQQGGGEWRSIYVYDLTNSPAIGDSVVIAGKVNENFGMTEIKDVTYFSVVAPDGIVAAPVVVPTGEAGAEKYEACLVKVVNATCTEANMAYGQWKVNDGSGDLLCKDNGAFSFEEQLNTVYDIIGVIHYSYGVYTLNYRRESDIIIVSSVPENFAEGLTVYPNPASDIININLPLGIDRVIVMEVSGKIIMDNSYNSENVSINISSLSEGIYFIKIEKDENYVIIKFVKE